MIYICLSLSFFLSLLFLPFLEGFANELPLEISFLNPTSLHQQDGTYVELKGFYTEHPDGSHTLSSIPKLKSCCVGKKDLRNSQLLLKGDFGTLKQDRVISLKGYLYKNPRAETLQEPFYTLYSSVENNSTESSDTPKNRSP